MRFVVIGAGAIGCAVAGGLSEAGFSVCLVARGAALKAVRRDGIVLQSTSGIRQVTIAETCAPDDLQMRAGDIVLVAVKSQHTEEVSRWLSRIAPVKTPVACVQNGIENERALLRRFDNVYGVLTLLPSLLVAPGHVACEIHNNVLDIGRYPEGVDQVSLGIAAALTKTGFVSRAVPDIMRWKAAKLIQSVRTSVEALCLPGDGRSMISRKLEAEAEAILDAAGMPFASVAEMTARRTQAGQVQAGEAESAQGKSSLWQSLERRASDVEADFFNGEIALLGRHYRVACPYNVAVQKCFEDFVSGSEQPGSLNPHNVHARALRIAVELEGDVR